MELLFSFTGCSRVAAVGGPALLSSGGQWCSQVEQRCSLVSEFWHRLFSLPGVLSSFHRGNFCSPLLGSSGWIRVPITRLTLRPQPPSSDHILIQRLCRTGMLASFCYLHSPQNNARLTVLKVCWMDVESMQSYSALLPIQFLKYRHLLLNLSNLFLKIRCSAWKC